METRPLVKGLIIGGIAVILAAIGILIYFLVSGHNAKTLRLTRADGTVTLEDGTGTPKTVTGTASFESGQTLTTGTRSLAAVSIDSDKKVTIQENSRVTFAKTRTTVEIGLLEGGLFFEVNKPLASDETFSIRTPNIVIGVRGTSGYVYTDEEGHPCLVVTAGHVKVTGINPVTNETKDIEVNAGQKLTVLFYNDRTIDSIEFVIESITEEGLPMFALERIGDDPYLLARVCTDTGWDASVLSTLAGGTISVPTDPTETSETEESTESSETSDTTPSTTESSETSESTSAETSETAPTLTATPSPTPTPKPARPTKKPTNTPSPVPQADPTASPASDTSPADPTVSPPTAAPPTVAPPTAAPPTDDPGDEDII